MSGNDLLRALDGVDLAYIEEAGRYMHPRAGQKRKLTLVLIAAVSAVLLAGCGVYLALHMQDFQLGKREVQSEQISAGAYTVESIPVTELSLAGVKGSKSYQAALEWYAFRNGYDPDYAIAQESADLKRVFPKKYDGYGVYSQEMQDKLDEIVQKYGVKLQGERLSFRSFHKQMRYLGLDEKLLRTDEIKLDYIGGENFSEGNFIASFNLLMEKADWEYPCMTSLYFCKNDCFSPEVVTLEDTKHWQEQNITTASGDKLLVLRSPESNDCWALCQRKDGLLAARIEADFSVWSNPYGDVVTEDRHVMPQETLLKLLSAIHFDLDPRMVDASQLEDPTVGDSQEQTHNGVTIGIKSMVSDGRRAIVTFGVTAPDGVNLNQGDRELTIQNFMDDFVYRQDQEEPRLLLSVGLNYADDYDGADNTCDLILDLSADETAPFVSGSDWTIHLENLMFKWWDAERWFNQNEMIAKGDWVFQVEFQDEPDCIEFATSPIPVKAVTCENLEAKVQMKELPITSLELRRLSLQVKLDFDGFWYSLVDERETPKNIQAVLDDGTVISLAFRSGDTESASYRAASEIPLQSVDHLILPDGTIVKKP